MSIKRANLPRVSTLASSCWTRWTSLNVGRRVANGIVLILESSLHPIKIQNIKLKGQFNSIIVK